METSSEFSKLAAALVAFHRSSRHPVRDAANPIHRSRYATLEAVIAATEAPLTAHGLCVTQHPGMDAEGYVTVRTVLLHESGEWMASECRCIPGVRVKGQPVAAEDPSAQPVGSAVTYLRRYALVSILGLSTPDDDGTEATRPQAQRGVSRQDPPPDRRADTLAYMERIGLRDLVIDGLGPASAWTQQTVDEVRDLVRGLSRVAGVRPSDLTADAVADIVARCPSMAWDDVVDGVSIMAAEACGEGVAP